MYIYQPKRETKAHIIIPVILILMFFAALSAARLSDVIPPVILQFAAVICIVFAIQIISRYSIATFTYEANDETRILSIRKTVGKKIQLAAALDYADIISVDKKDKDHSLKEKYNKEYKVHNFCNNIFPTSEYWLVCDIEGNDIAVVIEADKKLLEILEARKNGN